MAAWLRTACAAVGFAAPTDIQRACVPAILQGKEREREREREREGGCEETERQAPGPAGDGGASAAACRRARGRGNTDVQRLMRGAVHAPATPTTADLRTPCDAPPSPPAPPSPKPRLARLRARCDWLGPNGQRQDGSVRAADPASAGSGPLRRICLGAYPDAVRATAVAAGRPRGPCVPHALARAPPSRTLAFLAAGAPSELAFQIAEQFRVLGKGVNLKDQVIVGGLGA